MATQDYAASIQGVSIRVTRLDAAGNLLNGAGDSYVTSGFMRLSFTPEYEEGDEITEKNANGVVCVTYKSPDTLKRITMELAICEPDVELTNLLSGGLLLRKNLGTFANQDNKSIGWAAPAVGDDPAGYGVAVETWSHAIKDGKKSATLPYFHWVFPFVKVRQSGDRVIENGMLATTFEGYGLGNTQFQSGLDGRWEFPAAAERPYSYARSTWAPVGLQGFYTWSDATVATDPMYFTKTGVVNASDVNISSAAITTAANTTAIVTFDALPGVAIGDVIKVENLGVDFNGTVTVTAVNVVSNTVSYTIPGTAVAANVSATIANNARIIVVNSTTEASNTATTYSAVTDLSTVGGSTVAYNVPGNINFNPDTAVDRIVISNEDPTA
jgi:hypothetical protein